ncbi:hypothetical protein [Halobaculum sp. EA56]|uniref:hypothetical protein n=1 Tax=Halobaculum sp. EA56 TaxID=3421648 RepID=UPI003EBEBB04
MVGVTADPLVRLVLTGALCLVPTLAFYGLLGLLDRMRNDVLVEHTLRMAEESGDTSGLVGGRLAPAALGAERDGPPGVPHGSGSGDATEWDDPPPRRRLVLCSACATLRPSTPGPCPSCGAPLAEDEEGGGGPSSPRE